MNEHFLKYPVGPVAIKMAVAIGIGMLVGMERKWSNKEAGIRTFAIVALLGMLSAMIGQDFIIVSMIGVFLLIVLMNGRSIWVEKSLEITTSAALIVNYILGVMVGLGHIFTPVAGAIVMTMLLAWKTELNRFAGGLQPAEIRSAILLGLIGFVIYPILPDRYIDPWDLFNPSDAWLSVIAISGIGFVNYVLLRMFSTRGFYLSAIFGGLVNSTATAAEIAGRVQAAGLASRITTLVLLTNIAMFARNLLLVVMFSPDSLASTILPLLGMSLVSALWIWRDNSRELGESNKTITLELDSPISIKKVLWFGLLFLLIAIGGTLLTKVFGSYGMLATGIFGGMVSSASTTAAAATMASHGKITASVAGSVAVLSSLASAVITLPVVWKSIDDKAVVRKLTIELITVLAVGIAIVLLDRIFQFSELLLQ
jgi:uncharacterized membrane protein (DUF4010 family)